MKRIFKLFGLIMLLSILSCNDNYSRSNSAIPDMEVSAEAQYLKPIEDIQQNDLSLERKLIKEGHIAFETDQLNTTRKTIFEAVDKYQGYVSSDQEFNSPGRKSNTMVIRVPAENFDNFLNEATKGVKKIDSKDVNTKDVTEEFLDIEARLKTKKELETRYLDLLKQAKSVIEILEIEKQIGELRSEIESIEGRYKYLENRVSYSSLTMTFYERIPKQTEFGEKFKDGFRNGWNNFIWFFVGLTNLWPFILIGIIFIIGLLVYARRKKK